MENFCFFLFYNHTFELETDKTEDLNASVWTKDNGIDMIDLFFRDFVERFIS